MDRSCRLEWRVNANSGLCIFDFGYCRRRRIFFCMLCIS